ncbi:MAG TPA: HAD family phosphatase [Terriglobales bacterium]|nr:HAD family phosphatase [Terriglobales bacterium]
MPQISAIFWDVGGVLLSNAWDREQREKVLAQFGLDKEEFQDRHELLVSSLERGKITLDQYLDRTVFYRPRAFTRDQFKASMYSLSQPDNEVLEIARRLAASGRYLMGTINNESRELNAYRIEKFRLQEIFDVFVSSCFVGLRKPEEGIYRLALDMTQKVPPECCFIDDRPLNVESAKNLGFQGIEMGNAPQLLQDLQKLDVRVP